MNHFLELKMGEEITQNTEGFWFYLSTSLKRQPGAAFEIPRSTWFHRSGIRPWDLVLQISPWRTEYSGLQVLAF